MKSFKVSPATSLSIYDRSVQVDLNIETSKCFKHLFFPARSSCQRDLSFTKAKHNTVVHAKLAVNSNQTSSLLKGETDYH